MLARRREAVGAIRGAACAPTDVIGVSMFRAVRVLLLAARKAQLPSSRRPTFALWLAVIAAIGLVGCGGSNSPQARTTTVVTRTVGASQTSSASQTLAASDPLAGLVAKVRSAVIRIQTDACGAQEVGTGFLIGPRLVATVEHVVDGASSIQLVQGGRPVATGTVIGEDPARDVALVQSSVPISGRLLQLASRAPQLGESVAALGFPLGLPLTVTQGSISGLGRAIPIDGVRRRQLVQTDAAVNPGNSGGPLLAVGTGEVVGLVDLGTNLANGIGFAVSAQVAQPLMQAWQAAPQPIPVATCPSTQTTTVAAAPPTTSSSPAPAVAGPSATLRLHLEDLGSGQYQAAFRSDGGQLSGTESRLGAGADGR